MPTRTDQKPAAQVHMEDAAALNEGNLCVINASKPERRLVTKCCRATPILYLSDSASCSKCGRYFKTYGGLTLQYPKLVSRSSADAAAQRIGVQSSENVVRSNREAKAPKPLVGQKEFPI